MAIILVYNHHSHRMERYVRGEAEAMPYNTGRTLTVGEFRGSSRSDLMYTDRRVMEAFNTFRAVYGKPVYVGYCFKRIWEGGHGLQSQHYAGAAFDMGQNLSNAGRTEMRNAAVRAGVWVYVEPAYLTPTWVHVDRRLNPPACATGGYPLLRQGARNAYVCVLQDALQHIGYSAGGIDGIFGSATTHAVRQFQRAMGLSADGVVGCQTWTRLTNAVRG